MEQWKNWKSHRPFFEFNLSRKCECLTWRQPLQLLQSGDLDWLLFFSLFLLSKVRLVLLIQMSRNRGSRRSFSKQNDKFKNFELFCISFESSWHLIWQNWQFRSKSQLSWKSSQSSECTIHQMEGSKWSGNQWVRATRFATSRKRKRNCLMTWSIGA